MNKTLVGLAFITAGIIYGSLAIDGFYEKTLGWLVKNDWLKQPSETETTEATEVLGRKATIIFYASILIIIGVFILWKQ